MLFKDILFDQETQEASKIFDIDCVFIAVEIFCKDIGVIAKNDVDDEELWALGELLFIRDNAREVVLENLHIAAL